MTTAPGARWSRISPNEDVLSVSISDGSGRSVMTAQIQGPGGGSANALVTWSCTKYDIVTEISGFGDCLETQSIDALGNVTKSLGRRFGPGPQDHRRRGQRLDGRVRRQRERGRVARCQRRGLRCGLRRAEPDDEPDRHVERRCGDDLRQGREPQDADRRQERSHDVRLRCGEPEGHGDRSARGGYGLRLRRGRESDFAHRRREPGDGLCVQ